MNTYVLYHASCWDGFGAAWAAWRRLGNGATYIPVHYGNPVPKMEPKSRVYILDFSYPRAILEQLAADHVQVTVLDHHKTAKEALAGLGETVTTYDDQCLAPGLFVTFDMDHSGAVLAWFYFHYQDRLPLLLTYIQDRDLWLKRLSFHEEIVAWIRSHDYDFEALSTMQFGLSSPQLTHRALEEGRAILRAQQKQVVGMCREPMWITIGDHVVPAVNASTLISECGEYLNTQYPDVPFVATYFDRKGRKRQWSLRSRGTFDVSTVAQQYGGGGHPGAAGFVEERVDSVEV